jgi:glutamine amidotransferase
MGWNHVEPGKEDPLLRAFPENPRFYFVHSYHLVCDDPADVFLWTAHGVRFPAGVRRGNIWGTQFHPEKSHKFGLALLRNFVALP